MVPSSDVSIPGALLATSSTDANGNRSTVYTDGAGRTLAIEDAPEEGAEFGNFAIYGYDANSNRVVSRDFNGLGLNCEFDALNRQIACADLQEQEEGVSRTTEYNTASQMIASENAESERTTYDYDTRNRMVLITDPNIITTEYTYNANNNLSSLTDGEGQVRTWTYDARNLAIEKRYPGAATDFYTCTYDALQRMLLKTDQLGDTCLNVYDLAGRMTAKEYTSGGSFESRDTFVYDDASRILETTKGRHEVSTSHSYAEDGQPLTETFIIDGRSYVSERTYDPANRPLSHTFPSGEATHWSYDTHV